jgi:hypothetical protein
MNVLEVETLLLLNYELYVSKEEYFVLFNRLIVNSPNLPSDVQHDLPPLDYPSAISIDSLPPKLPDKHLNNVASKNAADAAAHGLQEPDAGFECGFRICSVCGVLYWPKWARNRCDNEQDHNPIPAVCTLRYSANGFESLLNGRRNNYERELGYRCCQVCGVVYWPQYDKQCRPTSLHTAGVLQCNANTAAILDQKTQFDHIPHKFTYSIFFASQRLDRFSRFGTTPFLSENLRVCTICAHVYCDKLQVRDNHLPHSESFCIFAESQETTFFKVASIHPRSEVVTLHGSAASASAVPAVPAVPAVALANFASPAPPTAALDSAVPAAPAVPAASAVPAPPTATSAASAPPTAASARPIAAPWQRPIGIDNESDYTWSIFY